MSTAAHDDVTEPDVPGSAAPSVSPPDADQRLRPYHWLVMVLGVLGYATIAADAAIFPTSYPVIAADLGFGLDTVSHIYALGFFTCGIVAMFAIGPLSDRFGRKPTFVFAVVICAAFTILTGTAWGAWSFAILRAVATVGYVAWGLAAVLIAESVPAKHRGWMTGAIPVGWALGFGLSAVVSGQLATSLGWRSVFWIVGALPLVFAVASHFLIRETPHFTDLKHARRTGRSDLGVDVSKANAGFFAQLVAPDIRRRTFGVSLFFLFIVQQYAVGSYYGLSYLADKGLDFASSNTAIAASSWIGIGTILASGFLTRSRGSHYSLTAVAVLGALVGLGMALFSTPDTVFWWFVAYVLISLGLWGGASNFLQEAFPTRVRGTGGAWGSGVLWCGYGITALTVTPLLSVLSWDVVLILFGVVFPMIALIGLWMVPRPPKVAANLEDIIS